MVLDPWTSLSLASSVVQFVDFGLKILKETKEVVQSANGILPWVTEIKRSTCSAQQISFSPQFVFKSNFDFHSRLGIFPGNIPLLKH